MTILTTTTRLLGMLAFNVFNGGTDSFTVGNLRLTYVGFYLELATHTVNDDVQVQLTHTGDDGLARFFVGPYAEGRIFLSQTAQSQAHLLLVSLGFRLNGDGDYRFREFHTLQDDRCAFVTQGVTGGDVLQADGSSDVACANFFDLFTLVGVHLNDTAETLALLFNGVQHGVTGVDHTGVNTEEGQVAHERVGSNLECQSRERLVIGSVTLVLGLAIQLQTVDSSNVGRSRQVLDHGIQHGLYALVLERGATGNQDDFVVQNTLTQSFLDLFFSQFFTTQVFFHQVFRRFSSGFNQVHAHFLRLFQQLSRDVFVVEGYALVSFAPVDGFHLDQVDNALEVLFGTDVQLQRNRVTFQTGLDVLNAAQEVGTGTVHLVDERDTGNLVLVSLTPYGFRLGLYATYGTVHHHGAIQNTHGTLYFDSKVNVARGIDDVDTVRLELFTHTGPESGGRGGGDGDTTLLFLFHPVHGGGAIVNFTDLVTYTGVKQNALGSSSLTGVDVSGDTDITITLNGGCTSHCHPLTRALVPR